MRSVNVHTRATEKQAATERPSVTFEPWEVQANTDAYTHIVRDRMGKMVASTPQEDSERNRSNARLIAAAPELLTALKGALETLRTWNGMGLEVGGSSAEEACWKAYQSAPEIKRITAAISKAEGK